MSNAVVDRMVRATIHNVARWPQKGHPMGKDSNDRTPNDDRSDSMNPNNDAYSASQDNRSGQLNPQDDRYHGGPSGD